MSLAQNLPKIIIFQRHSPFKTRLPAVTILCKQAQRSVRWDLPTGLNLRVVVTCVLRFPLAISLAPGGFSQGFPHFHSPQKQHTQKILKSSGSDMVFSTFSMRYFSENLNLNKGYNDSAYSMYLILIQKHFSSRKSGEGKAPRLSNPEFLFRK